MPSESSHDLTFYAITAAGLYVLRVFSIAGRPPQKLLEKPSLDTLQVCIQALNTKLCNHHLAPRKRAFNNSSPIGQLPNEILAWILGLASRKHSSHTSETDWNKEYLVNPVKRLHILAQVSSHWAAVIKSSPELWTVLDTSYSTREWSLVLRRSRDAPICIIHREDSHNQRYDSCINELLDHLPRCKTLQLKSHRLSEIFSLAGPGIRLGRLYRISLEAPSTNEAQRLDINLASAAPSLRDIILQHITLPWGSCRFGGLTSLHIKLVTWGQLKSPPLDWIFGVLQASPSLTSLSFRITWVDVQLEQDACRAHSPIHLPHLRNLYLGCHTFYTLRLLLCLEIPLCFDITLRISRELEDEPSLSSAPYMTSIHRYADAANLCLVLQDGGILEASLEYWGEKDTEPVDNVARVVYLEDKVRLGNLFKILPISAPFLKTIIVNEGDNTPASAIQNLVLPAWERTNSTTSLRLLNPISAHTYLVHLSQPIERSDPPQWLLPNLRYLEIQCRDLHRKPVLALVRARRADREAEEGAPVTLESIKLTACSVDQKLERMLHDISPNLDIAWQPME